MYIYHYCAMKQVAPNRTVYIDGLYTPNDPVESWEDYQKMKEKIRDFYDDLSDTNFTLIAFSMLTARGGEDE